MYLWWILNTIWTASSEFGTYSLCEQRRFRRACPSGQSRQNLRCSLIQAVSQEEPSDRKPDPWPLRMAGHAQLKFVMTECSKTQICLTGLILKWDEIGPVGSLLNVVCSVQYRHRHFFHRADLRPWLLWLCHKTTCFLITQLLYSYYLWCNCSLSPISMSATYISCSVIDDIPDKKRNTYSTVCKTIAS